MAFQVGQVGAKLKCTITVNNTAADLTAYNDVYIYVEKPGGTETTFRRSLGELAYEGDGTDGVINRVTTASTELDEGGTYLVQGRLTTAGGDDFRTKLAFFEVNNNL